MILRQMPSSSRQGFTLVEMAFVLVVMGLVILTVFPGLKALREANEVSLTHSNLKSLMVATAAFAQANGCLPCPATPGETGASFGKVGNTAGSGCGTCSEPQGIAPFVSLGVPASIARDGWGHWITMRVDSALTKLPTETACGSSCSVFVPPWSLCSDADYAKNTSTNVFCLANSGSPVGLAAKGICRASSTTAGSSVSGVQVITTGNGATQYAAVVFVSHGATGYGSYVASPKEAGCLYPFSSAYAACNGSSGGFAQCNSAVKNAACAQNTSNVFYDAPRVISDTDAYDDILLYASRNALLSIMGMGACSTTW